MSYVSLYGNLSLLKDVTEIEECVFVCFFYTVLVFHLSVVLLKYNW